MFKIQIDLGLSLVTICLVSLLICSVSAIVVTDLMCAFVEPTGCVPGPLFGLLLTCVSYCDAQLRDQKTEVQRN